jgi:hypothetical protein
VGRSQQRRPFEHGREILPDCADFYAHADAVHGKMYPYAEAAS